MDDVSVLLEHVDFLDGLDGLDVHLLESGLELLVVGTGGLVDLLDLAAGSTLASVRFISMLLPFLYPCLFPDCQSSEGACRRGYNGKIGTK